MMIKQSVSNMFKKNIYKVVVGGEGAVGKTTICQRLAGTLEREKDRLMTIGVDFHNLKIKEGKLFEAQVWDLGGQEQFRHFQQPFFKNTKIAIFVFSVEWFDTMVYIDFWLDMLKDENPVKIYLIGNKIDSPNRFVRIDEALEFARDRNLSYYEISATNGTGFENFKEDLIQTIQSIANLNIN